MGEAKALRPGLRRTRQIQHGRILFVSQNLNIFPVDFTDPSAQGLGHCFFGSESTRQVLRQVMRLRKLRRRIYTFEVSPAVAMCRRLDAGDLYQVNPGTYTHGRQWKGRFTARP